MARPFSNCERWTRSAPERRRPQAIARLTGAAGVMPPAGPDLRRLQEEGVVGVVGILRLEWKIGVDADQLLEAADADADERMLGDHAERALPEDQPQRVAAVEAHLGVLTLVHRLIGSSRAHPLAYALRDEGGMDDSGDCARAAGGDEEQGVAEKDHRRRATGHRHVCPAREREEGGAGGDEESEEIG